MLKLKYAVLNVLKWRLEILYLETCSTDKRPELQLCIIQYIAHPGGWLQNFEPKMVLGNNELRCVHFRQKCLSFNFFWVSWQAVVV